MAQIDKQFILTEIRRLSAENGGVAVGRLRLEADAGIKAYHWKKHWARYSDAVTEAGLSPNTLVEPYTEEELIGFVVALTREISRFPTEGDLLVKRTNDSAFPTAKTIGRLGKKAVIVQKVADYCRAHESHDDILALCDAATPVSNSSADAIEAGGSAQSAPDAYVYLMKSGRFYKIGRSVHAGARERQIALQMPEELTAVHIISTDDPVGIEAYWHQRFSEKRKNGEWFDLNRHDIAAFKRRKFM